MPVDIRQIMLKSLRALATVIFKCSLNDNDSSNHTPRSLTSDTPCIGELASEYDVCILRALGHPKDIRKHFCVQISRPLEVTTK